LLVITAEQKKVDDKYRRGLPRISTSPTLLVAPYYGADQDGSRAGYNPKFAERVRHAIYPQFMLDRLPLDRGPTESLLRLDHIQPVGMHYYSFEHSGYELSEEAVESILDDWIMWVLLGKFPADSLILDYQNQIKSIFGEQ
jgi:hypothetical protein